MCFSTFSWYLGVHKLYWMETNAFVTHMPASNRCKPMSVLKDNLPKVGFKLYHNNMKTLKLQKY